jgi:uncharacterized protein
MFISVKELELHPVEFDEQFAPGSIDYGSEVRQQIGLQTAGQAEMIAEHRGRKNIVEDIRVRGHLSTRLEFSCARCLDPVLREVSRDFDLLYRPLGVDRRAEEVSITEAETEIGYYQGEGLLLEDVLREQVLLAVPIKAVCRDDCKGLCPHCGRNLNQERCDCAEELADPRWDALKGLRDKLQS